MAITIVCNDCGKIDLHRAFGLCKACYDRLEASRIANANNQKRFRTRTRQRQIRIEYFAITNSRLYADLDS